jgi:hypothetical protein
VAFSDAAVEVTSDREISRLRRDERNPLLGSLDPIRGIMVEGMWRVVGGLRRRSSKCLGTDHVDDVRRGGEKPPPILVAYVCIFHTIAWLPIFMNVHFAEATG